MSVFDEWPWGYCEYCKMLVCVDDTELMVRHMKGYMTVGYNPSVRAECTGSNHQAIATPDIAFEETSVPPFQYDENGDPI